MKRGANQRRPARKAKGASGLWVLVAVVLVLVLGGGAIYATSAPDQTKPGTLVTDRTKVEMGNVPYSGGLGKASFNLTVQGGPVIVRGLDTT